MVARIQTVQLHGLEAHIVDIEVDTARGLHSFSIVGLADQAVGEAKERISSAIKNSGFQSPQKSSSHVTVSLSPADLRKEGSAYDLGIALGFLFATKQINFQSKDKIFLGELALSGEIRPIHGALLLAQKAKQSGFKEIYVPTSNAIEASLVKGVTIYPCRNLREITEHLNAKPREDGALFQLSAQEEADLSTEGNLSPALFDFADIKGQESAKRGLEIAAAGGHNVAMYGPPGTGKTLLAKAFAGILPPLDEEQIIETTSIHSVAGTLNNDYNLQPPFRSPHHTASYVSMVGGGAWPKPGEITLAHHGVLFLDEFPEFDKKVIESLRQPLEDKVISISRSKGTMIFPANFILIATMNPCPCGYRGSGVRVCSCNPNQLQKYERKMSGPIVDRIDLWLSVPQISPDKLSELAPGEESRTIRERIIRSRRIQAERFRDKNINTNCQMGPKDLEQRAPLSIACRKLLNDATTRLGLSARSYHRLIKVARTIADLAGDEHIKEEHLLEALQYRPKN